MPKVKIPRKSTIVDMTAMCDVAFLLLTFFMLTSNFTAKEPVKVVTPTSISEFKIPETNIETILIDKTGKIYLGIDGQTHRINLLKAMGDAYKITFTKDEMKRYSVRATTGVPMSRMKAFLDLPLEQIDNPNAQQGIPSDTTTASEFRQWVYYAKMENPQIVIAIKGDKETPFPVIKTVMKTLQDLKQVRFNLITGLKEVPKD
ncbi:MAG: biopolymer transporter ExbD [Bacteroidota bacterium]|nr:biopolymer transporter ExbD [Bacteroidota bacterium]